jgi:MFS family permease
MHLTTHDLLVPNDAAQHFPEPVNTVGWAEVCKGLYGILCGYLLILGSVIGAVVLAVTVIFQLAAKRPQGGAGGVFSLIIVGLIVLILLLLAGYGLIIRSQWRCLRNAPEHCGAKWWMFATMLCIVAGPALGAATSLAGGNHAAAKFPVNGKTAAPTTLREALAESKKAGATAAPMKVVSSVIGLLSQLFFVLFLRSVAVAFNDGFRARVAELYLLLAGVLFAGLVGLIVAPEAFLAKPVLLLLMAGGWALAAIWYFVLIISTCFCIQGNLAEIRTRPD